MLNENFGQFKTDIIRKSYTALHQLLPNNFDHQRFNFDGKDHSDEFFLEEHVLFLSWFFANCNPIYDACQLLHDTSSKQLFKDLLIYRLVGHLHYRISGAAIERNADRYQALCQVSQGQASDLPITGIFGNLVQYDFEWEGHRYVLDCMKGGMNHILAFGQYFYQRDGVSVGPQEGDHVIDGGACLGDTALAFSNVVGATGKVYAFDPVEDNLLVCIENVSRFPYQNVQVYPVGLSDKNVDAPPIKLNGYAPGFSSTRSSVNQATVPLRSLDFLHACGEVERVDFIKLDVEGAEMETLVGARNLINKFRPKLAISLYHRPNDFFEIINHIKNYHNFYTMHIDHYTIHREETVLYCSPTVPA